MTPRAVITGIGIVCASGIGVDTYWKTVLSGETRIGRITQFDPSRYDTTLAGEVEGFGAAEHMPSRFVVQTDRWTHLAFCAAGQALADAGIDPEALDPYDMSVALASASGGNAFGQRAL
ncbi:beta-ketoacyl synthase N-terminal-like domain-containing protein, partial [Frankia sp. CiP1_Cm_nod2]|uniref:beta-ketoacyl synthase N-terminal-like domain-containing protein n=1 Tax=Frankia sp. CiP1_Cm_nod2 TaxID=2897161 RepID=UPI0040443E56